MKKIFIIYFISFTIAAGNTYSLAGTDTRENMVFLMEEVGVKVFQIDLPWKDYHLNSIILGDRVENTFLSLGDLEATLDEIRDMGGRVIIQLSTHYVPPWFMENHRDKLLRNYRGGFEIQSEDLEKHIIPSPYSDLVKYEMIGPWYDYMARYLSKNYSDIIEYINPGILEEGQMSYPWSGYDGDELVFWSFDRYALDGYRSYLNRIFALSPEDTERSIAKLDRINEKYGTNFFHWSEVRPPQTYDEIRYYRADEDGEYPYFMEFLEFYAEGPLSSAKLYSDILQQYFPKRKLIIKIPHWHRGSRNKRTFAEGRFIRYYIRELRDHYGAILFLPVQDSQFLTEYIEDAHSKGFRVLLEPTVKVGDWREVDSVIDRVDIDGINAVNISDFLGDEGEVYRAKYSQWISTLEEKKGSPR